MFGQKKSDLIYKDAALSPQKILGELWVQLYITMNL